MSNLVVQLAKAPILNTVKTRMQTQLSATEALALHKAMTSYIARNLSGSTNWRYRLSISEPHIFFNELIGDKDIDLDMQVPGDLGVKLKSITSSHFSNSKAGCLVLIGSDCPSLSTSHIQEMFSALENQNIGVGLIPAMDGGYVAIGLSGRHTAIFDDIDWGSEHVYSQTLERAKELNLDVLSFGRLNDIDRPDDLEYLPRDLGFSRA